MTTITIQITVDAGPNAKVTVGPPTTATDGREATYVPPFEDELVPLPEGATALPGDHQVTPFRTSAHGNSAADMCPVHHVPWRTVPAGVSKKTGKPYAAFQACPERGCDQRPPERVTA